MRSFASFGEQGRDGDSCISFQNLIRANTMEEEHFPESRQADGSWLCFFLRLSVNWDCVYKVSQTQQSTTIWSLGAPQSRTAYVSPVHVFIGMGIVMLAVETF
jgi:hypothetical protein